MEYHRKRQATMAVIDPRFSHTQLSHALPFYSQPFNVEPFHVQLFSFHAQYSHA